MHRSRFAFLAAADIGIIATFLPWEKILVMGVASESHAGTEIAESVLGTRGVGWISMVLFAVVVAICFAGQRSAPIAPPKKWIVVVMGLLACIIGVHTFFDVRQKAVLNPLDTGGISFESSPGIGIYLVIAAGMALILMGVFLKGIDGKESVKK